MRKTIPILFFLILISAFGVGMVKAVPKYTPLNVWEYYNETIESKMVFDGANYLYVTPYGNYSITQPLNVLSFTDHNGKEVVEKSVFVLQHNQTGSWVPLLDFYDTQGDPVVTIANNTHFELSYNIYDKKIKIASAFFRFTVNENPEIKPKIEVDLTVLEDWDKGSYRWIWDIVPSSDYKYWRNQTTGQEVDINDFQGLTELYNNTPQNRLKFKDTSNILGVLDVSDFEATLFYGGQEPNWNTRGFVAIFPVNETTIDPITYTESAPNELILTELGGATTWHEYNITGNNSIPFNSVVEMISANGLDSTAISMGVRNTSSVLDRKLLLNEAEDGGYTCSRFLTYVSGTGIIDVFGSAGWQGSDLEYYIVGYWEDVTFTEQWTQYNTLASEDDMWHETDGSELSLQANRTHLITLINSNTGTEDYLGVRTTSSALDRRLEVMEAEGGGVQTASMFVQTDTDSKIDVYTSDYTDVYFINQGYFDENITFRERFIGHGATNDDDAWHEYDISAILENNDGYVTDVLCLIRDSSLENLVGVRINGSSDARYLQIREAEGGGHSAYGMSVKSDENGVVEEYNPNYFDTPPLYYYTGYFVFYQAPPPTPPTIYDPSLLFGAGFNWSDPFVHIRWNHSGTVSNYTVQHSTDGVAFSVLVVTPNKYYNHTSLNNGSYHWYKVRADYYWNVTPEWLNSSFTEIDLERVWFAITGGVCPPANVTEIGGAWVEYNVSSITVIDGTYDVGWLNSTEFVDGNVYRVNETVGADCLEVRMNFTNIPEDALSLSFRSYCEYEGNPAHIVNLEAWNFVTSSWDLFFILVEHGFDWHNASLSIGDYIEDGNVWIRWDHVTNGASGHYLTVDYLKLRAFIPSGEIVDAWDIEWLLALIWLGLTAIGITNKSGVMTIFAGFFGLVLGILMLPIQTMVAISLILLNLYLIYTGSS